MDLGAEYHGYTADVTRTIPANGKFSKEQKLIYDIVYKAQEASINASIIGGDFYDNHVLTQKIINNGLAELNIIKTENSYHTYYPHGSSHHIGLDVHDPGISTKFKENMVITIEPGIYIPEEGIGCRLENDILITEFGNVNLTAAMPIEIADIEAIMNS